ncbi:FkbM family methyltransferase [Chloroflexota bacterium]
MEIQGSKMYMNPDNLPKRVKGAFKHYAIYGIHEKLTTEIFRHVVRKGDVVVDLGANMGYYTLLASRLIGEEGRVYAFEPETVNYGLLTKNIEINVYKNIIPAKKAVSNTTGTVRFSIDERTSGEHRIRQHNYQEDTIEVESVTLDDFFHNEERPISVIKMDIEGAEMAALMGMRRIIRENENLKIFTEFNPLLIKEMGYGAEEFAHRLLEDYLFSILAIDEYANRKRCSRVNSVVELMEFCKSSSRGFVNLFLEKS